MGFGRRRLNRPRPFRIYRGMQDLSDSVAKDTEGRDVRLGDLWRDRPVVLAFVRHFG